jgi:16S rRNA (uracil1498-N3)-methyltransferase
VNIFIATIDNDRATLRADESWHCAKVLRKRTGDDIRIIDGKGSFYSAVLTVVSEKKCEARITSGPEIQAKRNYHLHLAIAPTKQVDRMEWMIEKAVEIGIDEITFIHAKNSERTVIKTDRIMKVVESAIKQSLQARIPKVNEITGFKEVICVASEQKLIAWCGDGRKTEIWKFPFAGKNTLVLIGPEGDFTQAEADAAIEKGFVPVSLGETRLRTETAGLYVCQLASIISHMA